MTVGKPIISSSVKYTEILVARRGLMEVVCTLEVMHIHLEGDSASAISLIHSIQHKQDRLYSLSRDIQLCISKCISFHVYHVSKEANQLADFIAKHAHNG